jgi:hypothetical protein
MEELEQHEILPAAAAAASHGNLSTRWDRPPFFAYQIFVSSLGVSRNEISANCLCFVSWVWLGFCYCRFVSLISMLRWSV